MSKIPENTLDILERNIKALKDSKDTLTMADIKRLETLINIRKVLITNGTETVHVVHKHEDVSDKEILDALKKPRKEVGKKKAKAKQG